jgi:predicted cupin superfamily sugar epimerase
LAETAEGLITRLGLQPHPEGGFFRETWRDVPPDGGRGVGTSILFLLREGEASHWHRVDAVECWHWHAGAPMRLRLSKDGTNQSETLLGVDFAAGQTPFGLVPKGWWQAAAPVGGDVAGYTLVGCTVSPAFKFAGFELAPRGWEPKA